MIFGLFDLGTGLLLAVFLVVTVILALLPRRVARMGKAVRVSLLVAAVAGVGLFVLFNVAYFNGFGTDPVTGSPTRAQVTGTWVGGHGATLVLRPDGTFTASGLPPYVGDGTGFFATPGLPRNPAAGHGRWVIGPGEFSGPPESVIFTFVSCDGIPNGCAGYASSFDLQAETANPSGSSPALFYYTGDPDDWTGQYAFIRR